MNYSNKLLDLIVFTEQIEENAEVKHIICFGKVTDASFTNNGTFDRFELTQIRDIEDYKKGGSGSPVQHYLDYLELPSAIRTDLNLTELMTKGLEKKKC